MGENHFASMPVALYGVDLFFCAIAYYILERTLIAAGGSDSRLAKAVGAEIKGWISTACYLVGVVSAIFWSQWVALALYALVALMWLIPDRRIERTLGRGSSAA
jgi:uncharacterized membrane protein